MSQAYGGRKLKQLRAQVIATYGRYCWLCGGYIHGLVSIDHVVPRSLDPTQDVWSIDGVRPAHPSCNSGRGNRPPPAHTKPKPKPSRDW